MIACYNVRQVLEWLLAYDLYARGHAQMLLYLLDPHVEGDQWGDHDHLLHVASDVLYGDSIERRFSFAQSRFEEESVRPLTKRPLHSFELMRIRLRLELHQ